MNRLELLDELEYAMRLRINKGRTTFLCYRLRDVVLDDITSRASGLSYADTNAIRDTLGHVINIAQGIQRNIQVANGVESDVLPDDRTRFAVIDALRDNYKGIATPPQEQRSISVTWYVDDVLSVRPELTEDEAWRVLQRVHKECSGDVGITWDVLRDTPLPLP